MNRRAAVSVDAIRKVLPLEPPGELLLLIIFGSQVRNEEKPESDLDILCVTRTGSKSFYEALHKTMAEKSDGVRGATVLEHTPQTIGRNANLYGMPEYGALRGYHNGESVILYRSKDACSELDGIMAGGVGGCRGDMDGHNEKDECDTDWCARQWFDISGKLISDGLSRAEEARREDDDNDGGGRRAKSICTLMHRSIDHAIRACLLHHDVMFPFTRDTCELYGLLPPEGRMPLDLDALRHWDSYSNRHAGRMQNGHDSCNNYTMHDADVAIDAAKETRAFVSEKLSAARPASGPRRSALLRFKHISIIPRFFNMQIPAAEAAAPRT